jgi:hypothetical protein
MVGQPGKTGIFDYSASSDGRIFYVIEGKRMNKYQRWLSHMARKLSKFQPIREKGETFKSIRKSIKHKNWWVHTIFKP